MTSPKTSSSASASSLSQRSNSGWYRTSTRMQFSTYALKPMQPPAAFTLLLTNRVDSIEPLVPPGRGHR